MRSLTAAAEARGEFTPEDRARHEHLEKEARSIGDALHEQHERELQEIRAGSAGGTISQATLSRQFAREPLYEAFRSAGFARGNPAEIPWAEFRAITWSGSIDNLSQPRRVTDQLGYDVRYGYQALPSVGVDAGVTSARS